MLPRSLRREFVLFSRSKLQDRLVIYMRRTFSSVRTLLSLEDDLITERREGFDDHLRELQSCPTAAVDPREGTVEALK